MMQDNSSTSNFKYVLRIGVFLGVVLLAAFFLGQKYEAATEHNVVNSFTQSRYDDFYALTPNSLDLVFLGSSHAYCTFDPANFDTAMGISSFQLGTPLQHPDITYCSLLEVLKTQSPKVAVVDLYWDVLDEDFEMLQAASFFEVLQDKTAEKAYVKAVFPLNEKVKYQIPVIKNQQDFFAYEGNQIKEKLEAADQVLPKIEVSAEGSEYYVGKGYVYCDDTIDAKEYDETNQFKDFDGTDWEFDKTQKSYLEKIIALCRAENIELIFTTAPVANVSMDYIKNYRAIHDTIAAFAAENRVKYLDLNLLNQEETLLANENFRDDAHLNDSGVKIIDEIFKAYLAEHSEALGASDTTVKSKAIE